MTRTTSFSTTLNPASVVEDGSSTGTEQAKQGARAAGPSETAAPAAIAKLSQIGGGEGGRFRIRALEREPAPAHAEVTDQEVKDLSMALDARADQVEKYIAKLIKQNSQANPSMGGLWRGIAAQQPDMETVISDLIQESVPYLRAIAAS